MAELWCEAPELGVMADRAEACELLGEALLAEWAAERLEVAEMGVLPVTATDWVMMRDALEVPPPLVALKWLYLLLPIPLRMLWATLEARDCLPPALDSRFEFIREARDRVEPPACEDSVDWMLLLPCRLSLDRTLRWPPMPEAPDAARLPTAESMVEPNLEAWLRA